MVPHRWNVFVFQKLHVATDVWAGKDTFVKEWNYIHLSVSPFFHLSCEEAPSFLYSFAYSAHFPPVKPECSLVSCSQVDAGRVSDVEALASLLEGGHGVLLSPLVLIWVSWCGAAALVTFGKEPRLLRQRPAVEPEGSHAR